jgi:alkylmercury lyase
MRQVAVSIKELEEKIVGAVPPLDPTSRLVVVRLYRLLAEGKPVPVRRLAKAVDLLEETISEILSRHPAYYDEQGAVIGFGGLTVVEMPPHLFQVEGRRLFTWCAWDSLFIPSILGKTAEVTSVEPLTRKPISLTVAPDGVKRITPKTTVVSFLTPDRAFDRNVIENFCHFIHFFSSPEAGEAWTAKHPGTFLLSLDDAFALGQQINARHFLDELAKERDRD